MKRFRFVKLSNRWFVDIPWEGDITDLEMVAGANTLLECYSKDGIVECTVLEDTDSINSNLMVSKLKCTFFDKDGAFYDVNSELYKGEIWLCPVLKHLFGKFPEYLNVVFN